VNATSQPGLAALQIPLNGSTLIEASAGTGKTYTLALLYLRLILGHGESAAYSRPLEPGEILVVTFTDAATRELRSRIRRRLSEAAQAFAEASGEAPLACDDPNLAALISTFPPTDLPSLAERLRQAADRMDEAAVSTIHSWCARMLREHAFDSGSHFDLELDNNDKETFRRVVRDYWRTHFQELDVAQATVLRSVWKSPELLEAQLRVLADWHEWLEDIPSPQDQLAPLCAEIEVHRIAWVNWVQEVRDLIDEERRLGHVHGNILRQSSVASALARIEHWATGRATAMNLDEIVWLKLTPAGLESAWKGRTPPAHPAFESMARLEELRVLLELSARQLLMHAARWCAQRMHAERLARGSLGFQDLLSRLDQALSGQQGEPLARAIRTQFPVALVDEFQDTDPIQFRIFDAIYRIENAHPETAILMIGDPKQAIYGFRSADIYTYLRAKRLTHGRHVCLSVNHRSSASMVDAVNQFFRRAEDRPGGAGAFLIGRGTDGIDLAFHPVTAAGQPETWMVDGREAPALTIARVAHEVEQQREKLSLCASVCAQEIAKLLAGGRQGTTGFGQGTAQFRPLNPADIAILVDTGTQAKQIRDALSAHGLRSVFLSERESVLDSLFAADLELCLRACADPADERTVRAALASSVLALDWASLERCVSDETYWEACLQRFLRYSDLWRRHGVLAMLHRLFHEFRIPEQLLAAERERDLTDLLHLAEWLQQTSMTLDGPRALIGHFAEQRSSGLDAQSNPALRRRLESDANLIKVITVHKAKGLEFPVVFLPFAWTCRSVDRKDLIFRWHDELTRQRVSTVADAASIAKADRERLAEDLRKLYVALTRAKYATWLAVAPSPQLPGSALGYLLGVGDAAETHQVWEALDALCAETNVLSLSNPTQSMPGSFEPTPQDHPNWRAPLEAQRSKRALWVVSSYSAIVAKLEAAEGSSRLPESAADETFTELTSTGSNSSPSDLLDDEDDTSRRPAPRQAESETPLTLHHFPRGASHGSFLHGLLQWAGEHGFARCASAADDELCATLDQRCTIAGYARWQATLHGWLKTWLSSSISLDSLSAGFEPITPRLLDRYLVEMEFWIPAHGLNPSRLDEVAKNFCLAGRPRRALSAQSVNGMLRGFIDLVFEHQGRYFVLDYKSNYLGPSPDDYTSDRMAREVITHRYDLQLVIYLYALHRLLKARLGANYDYEKHMGGALYLFVRGIDSASGGLHAERPPEAMMVALDEVFGESLAADPRDTVMA
jgi:exodeoxyribonuclease V beta subunit